MSIKLRKDLWLRSLAILLMITGAAEMKAEVASQTTFSSVSGSLDTYISYASFKGDGTSNPAINSNHHIRLYQPSSTTKTTGGYITFTAKEGVTITKVVVGSNSATSARYKVDDGAMTTTDVQIASGRVSTIDTMPVCRFRRLLIP